MPRFLPSRERRHRLASVAAVAAAIALLTSVSLRGTIAAASSSAMPGAKSSANAPPSYAATSPTHA